jgi:hypothetical protein
LASNPGSHYARLLAAGKGSLLEDTRP